MGDYMRRQSNSKKYILLIGVLVLVGIVLAQTPPSVYHPLREIVRTSSDLTSVDANGDGVIDAAALPSGTGGTNPWSSVTGGIGYSGGLVGIGTTTPIGKLTVEGADSDVVYVKHTSGTAGNALYATQAGGMNGNAAVYGVSTGPGAGVRGESGTSGFAGVYGVGGGNNPGVRGYSGSAFAGYFDGKGYFSGAVGIGTTSPSAMVHIVSGSPQAASFTGTTPGTVRIWGGSYVEGGYTNIDLSNAGTGGVIARIGAKNTGGGTTLSLGTSSNYASGITNEALSIAPSGNVGIGQTNPQRKLQVAGDILAEGDFYDGGMPAVSSGWDVWMETNTGRFGTAPASSIRYKENVENIPLGLGEVLKLRPVLFTYKQSYVNDKTQHAGFIAEEVNTVSPLLVQLKDGQIEDVKYKEITPLLVKAIQEQQALIVSLRARIEALEKR
ncbi:tail fiber domain-containing protein [Candidatus Woesearchaeota archaeon]|nr:tail fiber domain-containing protein [Candidatus Woesearchaeota archaeon]